MNSLQRANFQYDAKAALHYSETTIFYGKIRRLGFAECRFSYDSILRRIKCCSLERNHSSNDICVISRFCKIFSAVGKKKERFELPGLAVTTSPKIQDAGRSNFHVLIVF